jgi:hypothetical protein
MGVKFFAPGNNSLPTHAAQNPNINSPTRLPVGHVATYGLLHHQLERYNRIELTWNTPNNL